MTNKNSGGVMITDSRYILVSFAYGDDFVSNDVVRVAVIDEDGKGLTLTPSKWCPRAQRLEPVNRFDGGPKVAWMYSSKTCENVLEFLADKKLKCRLESVYGIRQLLNIKDA